MKEPTAGAAIVGSVRTSSFVSTLAPRAGFALLLLTLAGVAGWSAREAAAGHAAVAAERARLELATSEAFRGELRAALDVAEARLEALDTLPLLDEQGLLLERDGLQWLPRRPGQRSAHEPLAEDVRVALDELLRGLAPTLGPAQRGLLLDAANRGETPVLPRPLSAAEQGALRSLLQHAALSAPARLAWHSALVEAAVAADVREPWVVELAGPGRPASGGRPQEEGLQSLVLRAWPWLERGEAGRRCLEVRRLGERLGVATEALSAACTRGLAGVAVHATASAEPWLAGAVLSVEREVHEAVARHDAERGRELRGVLLDLPARLDEVTRSRRVAGVLAADDVLTLPTEPGALSTLRVGLRSPRLDALDASHATTLRWKLGLAFVIAALGAVAMALASLAQRRRDETLIAQREFIATVSHELRTPLASVRLLAETLERRLEGHAPARDYPRRLVQAADGLTFLVDNILSFNRLEAGRWTPAKEPFVFTALEPLVRAELALAPSGEAELTMTGLEAMAPHEVDPRLLEILVRNLARNAWKYAQRQPLRFAVEGRDEGDVAVLRFTDNGPGIPAAEHARVFEAFHRLAGNEGRAAGGSGLGLALARRIAELHGGTLRITSSSKEGTTFELRLPRSPAR